jgi:hypothetical protein
MKLSRSAPYRQRRHPIVILFWLVPILLVLLLVLSWWKGGEKPIQQIEIPVPAETLGG